MSATHNPVCVCTMDRRENIKDLYKLNTAKTGMSDRAYGTHRQVKDIHEDRVAFLCLFIETSWGPDPVQIGSI